MSSETEDLSIKLQDDQVRMVVAGAIMTLFTEQQRETLMKGAIAHLMTPKRTGNYGPEVTPLSRIFNESVESAARKWFYDRLTGEEDTKEKTMLQEALTEVIMKVLSDDNRTMFIDAMAEGMAEAFRKMRLRDY
jgi:hypothetical protein